MQGVGHLNWAIQTGHSRPQIQHFLAPASKAAQEDHLFTQPEQMKDIAYFAAPKRPQRQSLNPGFSAICESTQISDRLGGDGLNQGSPNQPISPV
jgi:hypothetical protein